ncbi:MAG: penicillin-binding transpeptidase domain-containing protein [Muribaculaceae bacterium]|nr:penicillin-binding transpeptidase domain-containing protein [Muribaculaceae bacterium]
MLLVLGIIKALFTTTIIDVDKWNDKAAQLLAKEIAIEPERGDIYAANGTLLATNLHYYTARIDWRTEGINMDSLRSVLPHLCDSLAVMFPQKSANEWADEFIVEMSRVKKKRTYKLASKLTYTQYRRLKTFPFFRLRPNKNGLYYETETKRIKPYGSMASRSIGGVAEVDHNYYTAYIDWKTPRINADTLNRYSAALCDSLASMFPKTTSAEWREKIRKEYTRHIKDDNFIIASRLSYMQYQRLKKFPYLKKGKEETGFFCDTQIKISYSQVATQNDINVAEMSRGTHGISGLEMALDSLLYGVPGVAKKIQLTNNITNWETIPAKRGYDIKTTIDINIQDMLEEELNNMCIESDAKWGTAIIMEVATGEIKAISNLERDPRSGQYVEGTNNAVLGYEPGSVMKPISMMMALEDGIVSNIDSVIVTGHIYAYAGGRPISDGGHGAASMPVRAVIERSSNVGMSKIILRKYERDPGQFYHRLKQMGFFEPLNTGIAGERIPAVDSLGTKNWDRIALTRMCYGYSTKIPPMYTMAMYNAIANNGKYVRPHLVKELMIDGKTDSVVPVSYIREQVCSPKNAAKLRQMLNDVVWGERGTAKVLRNKNVNISGKTGTCFTIKDGQYTTQKRLAFCGFFPYDKPKYTCMVLMLGANCGAARCSGMVLHNVALKLYARGMLNNTSSLNDSINKTINPHRRGEMYASKNINSLEIQKREMNISQVSHYKSPVNTDKGKVPSVIGYGLRDALATLEDAGLNVKFKGYGFVAAQSLKPGVKYKRGDVIYLTLKK